MWKLGDEAKLLYKSAGKTIDTLSVLNDNYFLSGSWNSTVELWNARKKTAVHSLPATHSSDWICSMVLLRDQSNVFLELCKECGCVCDWLDG